MQLKSTVRGVTYRHRDGRKVKLIGCHPEDGACLIVEHYDEAYDDFTFDSCEASDLMELSAQPQEPLPKTGPLHWLRWALNYSSYRTVYPNGFTAQFPYRKACQLAKVYRGHVVLDTSTNGAQ